MNIKYSWEYFHFQVDGKLNFAADYVSPSMEIGTHIPREPTKAQWEEAIRNIKKHMEEK